MAGGRISIAALAVALVAAAPVRAFVNALAVRVNLKTIDGHYLVADNGGGSSVRADRQNAIDWGTFVLSALNGDPPLDGDLVSLGTSDGEHYLEADDGGGKALLAATTAVGGWETFVISSGTGGPIREGDTIELHTATDPPWFVTAEEGGGGAVNVNRRTDGPWQRFTLVLRPLIQRTAVVRPFVSFVNTRFSQPLCPLCRPRR